MTVRVYGGSRMSRFFIGTRDQDIVGLSRWRMGFGVRYAREAIPGVQQIPVRIPQHRGAFC